MLRKISTAAQRHATSRRHTFALRDLVALPLMYYRPSVHLTSCQIQSLWNTCSSVPCASCRLHATLHGNALAMLLNILYLIMKQWNLYLHAHGG